MHDDANDLGAVLDLVEELVLPTLCGDEAATLGGALLRLRRLRMALLRLDPQEEGGTE